MIFGQIWKSGLGWECFFTTYCMCFWDIHFNSFFSFLSSPLSSGEDSWPSGCCLKFYYGDQMTHVDRVMSGSLGPGQMTDISVDMVSPSKTGIYQGQWRMITPSGSYFGGLYMCVCVYMEVKLFFLKMERKIAIF